MKNSVRTIFILLAVLPITPCVNLLSAQVSKVADIQLGSVGSNPKSFTSFQNSLIFTANDGVHGEELWRHSDSGTELIHDINPGIANSMTGKSTVYLDEYIFAARDSVHGVELWRYDGENVEMIIDIRPEQDSSSFPYLFTEYQGDLYFVANDSFDFRRLWKYNGETCIPVTDLDLDIQTSRMVVANGLLFFAAATALTGNELFKWNGQTAEIVDEQLFGALGSIPSVMVDFNNQLYFVTHMPFPSLCKTEGNTIDVLYTFNSSGGGSITQLMPFEGSLFFSAYNNNFGYELWQHNPVISSTEMIYDIAPGNVWSFVSDFECFNGSLFFTASDNSGPESYNFELWEYSQGVIQEHDLNPFGSAGAHDKLSIDSLLIFSGRHPELGFELNTYNGIEFTTYDINIGSLGSAPLEMTIHENAVYFSANDSISGFELWRFGPALEAKLTSIEPIIYPNPSSLDYITLNYGEWSNCEIRIIDNFGRIIDGWIQIAEESKLMDISSYRAGIYYVQVKSTDKQIVLKLNTL